MTFNRLRGRGLAGLAAAVFAPMACAQYPLLSPEAPSISSLQSGFVEGEATHGAAITAGTNITGFTLFINGTFHPGDGVSETVVWNSPVHGIFNTQPNGASATQITAFIPATEFNVADAASVTVVESPFTQAGPPVNQTSNALTFTVNPPMSLPPGGALLPIATVGSPYSAIFLSGGTGPFSVEMEEGVPPGMAAPSSGNPFTGTPTAGGIYPAEFLISDSWQNEADLPESFAVLSTPTITSLSPSQAVLGSPALTFAVTGTNFVSTQDIANTPVTGSTVQWGGSVSLATTFIDSSHLTAVIPATLLGALGVHPIYVSQPGGSFSNSLPFTVFLPALQIQVPSSFNATTGAPYDLRPSASGGTPPYSWGASGLPAGLSINRATGEISGSASQAGSFPIVLTVTDSTVGTAALSASTRFVLVVSNPPLPPLQLTGATLSAGTVGQPYSYTVLSTGGAGNPYTYSVTAGSLPGGLTLTAGGGLFGTPTTAGTSTFTVQTADSAGNTATASFSLTINPAPLTITGTLIPVTVGSSVSTKFGAAGGTPPYTFSLGGSTAPPGTQLASDGTLSGTATTAGTFAFRVTVTDSAKNSATQSFTLQVNAAPLTIATTALPPATTGSPYSTTLAGAGGTPPYTWAVTGLPAGLSGSSAGVITGTPTTTSTASVSITVTDSTGAHASATLSLTVVAAPLTLVANAMHWVVGSEYAGGITVTGGVAPYSVVFAGLPPGLSGGASAPGGIIFGAPTQAGTFTVSVTVTDAAGASAKTSFQFVIAPSALAIPPQSLPQGTVGTTYFANITFTDGAAPIFFSATGLPPGISIGNSGALTGTPTTAGTFPFTVTVSDGGAQATGQLQITIVLPTLPPVTFPGAPSTTPASTQNSVQIGLGSSFPVDVTVKLTLTFTPTSGADDPAVQFATGGRSAQLTVPAGTTLSSAKIGVQSGTVAGTITITAQLLAGTQDITPFPAPKQTITIPAGPPVITSVTATRNSTGFTVTVVGYASTRSVTQAIFQFAAASGSSLQSSSATITTDPLFVAWFGSTAAAPFGGQFTLTQPFTVSGSPQSIASVTVTLMNGLGNSNVASANLQ